ncbi:MAG TPA: flagellar basal body P-ring formation chaperone FlgA [Pseudomonadales bacterium]|nr:flagellar basal body P-ring formation chaperone FlgA [Pseudomonadales bacterium]
MSLRRICNCLFTILFAAPALGFADGVSVPQIKQSVSSFLQDWASNDGANHPTRRYEVEIGYIDPSLNLPACPTEPLIEPTSGSQRVGRVTAKVTCNTAWSIYVSANIKAYETIVVTATAVPRESQLTKDQLLLKEMDVTALRQGFYTSPDDVVGSVAKRAMPMDTVLTPSAISAPRLVKKGELVSIIASDGKVSVRAVGVALSEGAMGDLIQVQNKSSKKIVYGRINGPGSVAVNY